MFVSPHCRPPSSTPENNPLRAHHIDALFYITPIENLKSILLNGILCRNLMNQLKKDFYDFSNHKIQERRKAKGLHNYVPLLFNPECALLYDVYNRTKGRVVVLSIRVDVVMKPGTLITDRNAATKKANIYKLSMENFEKINFEKIIKRYNPKLGDDMKQITQAEVLIKHKVEPDMIYKVIYPAHLKKDVKEIASEAGFYDIVQNQRLFSFWR